jgi:hypothetical protein
MVGDMVHDVFGDVNAPSDTVMLRLGEATQQRGLLRSALFGLENALWASALGAVTGRPLPRGEFTEALEQLRTSELPGTVRESVLDAVAAAYAVDSELADAIETPWIPDRKPGQWIPSGVRRRLSVTGPQTLTEAYLVGLCADANRARLRLSAAEHAVWFPAASASALAIARDEFRLNKDGSITVQQQ